MKKWSDKSVLEKTSDVISWIAFAAWLLFEMIEKNAGAGWTSIASRIAIIVICIFEGISYWNERRVISYVAMGGVLLLVATFVLECLLLA